jgi:ATP-dependent DNA ligase
MAALSGEKTLAELSAEFGVHPTMISNWKQELVKLIYAGRAGTGIKQAELERLWRRFQPLSISQMPLAVPPPRDSRFGSPLVLSRVHWVRPELVAEVKFLTWTDDNLLARWSTRDCARTSPASEVRRDVPHPNR